MTEQSKLAAGEDQAIQSLLHYSSLSTFAGELDRAARLGWSVKGHLARTQRNDVSWRLEVTSGPASSLESLASMATALDTLQKTVLVSLSSMLLTGFAREELPVHVPRYSPGLLSLSVGQDSARLNVSLQTATNPAMVALHVLLLDSESSREAEHVVDPADAPHLLRKLEMAAVEFRSHITTKNLRKRATSVEARAA